MAAKAIGGAIRAKRRIMKRVAIIQSNYIPWKGYFDIIHDVDLFIFLDDVQFTTRDWRNRNRIKTPNGLQWLTVPVGADRNRLIHEVNIVDDRWHIRHWEAIKLHYGKAPYFRTYEPFLEHLYLDTAWHRLSELNQFVIRTIATDCLGISVEFRDSREFQARGTRLDRLLDLLVKAGATHYLSGPSAKDYLDETRLQDAGIHLSYKDYAGYPEYPQLHGPFEHAVTILDTLLHCGPEAPFYIWGWRPAVLTPDRVGGSVSTRNWEFLT